MLFFFWKKAYSLVFPGLVYIFFILFFLNCIFRIVFQLWRQLLLQIETPSLLRTVILMLKYLKNAFCYLVIECMTYVWYLKYPYAEVSHDEAKIASSWETSASRESWLCPSLI